MIDLFVQFNPGYTHAEAERMEHRKFLHYLEIRIGRGVPATGGLF